jgi:hypothetical protein
VNDEAKSISDASANTIEPAWCKARVWDQFRTVGCGKRATRDGWCADCFDVLLAACKAAESLAWEAGCETEDGVHTLLTDSRGDLYRQISAAIAKAEGRA